MKKSFSDSCMALRNGDISRYNPLVFLYQEAYVTW